MTASDRLDATFAALADPTRRAILTRLSQGDASVTELAQPFKMSQPAISKHLKVLENAGLISRSQDAQRRPRRIEAAAVAGSVLPIKPDTDVYLLAAMLNEIDRTTGFAAEATERHGRNVEALRAFVAEWTPERVAPVTGIDAATIRTLARDFASARAACAHMSTGVNMGRQGTLAYWLLHMLVFVTGNLGTPGGNFYSQGFYARSTAAGAHAPREMVDGPFGRMRRPGGVGISLPGTLLANYVLDPAEPVSIVTRNRLPARSAGSNTMSGSKR